MLQKGYHLYPEGGKLYVDIASNMNRGRLSTNKKSNDILDSDSIVTKDRIDNIFNKTPKYIINSQGHISNAESGINITKAKCYKILEYNNANDVNSANSISYFYLNTKSELIKFFGLSDVTIYKHINNNKVIIKENKFYKVLKIM